MADRKYIHLGMNPELKEKIQEQAEAMGMTEAAYIRGAVIKRLEMERTAHIG